MLRKYKYDFIVNIKNNIMADLYLYEMYIHINY